MTLEGKARLLGASELRTSWRQGKKFAVNYQGKWIHFGAVGYEDFTTHRDLTRRANYRKRHSAVRLKDGRLAYQVKTSPSFWAWHLLW